MALPNLIIAGVNKAGTTSLWTYLAAHPEVGPSAVKETCYWLPLRYADEALSPITDYAAQFAGQGDMPVRMESTPGYFFGGRALAEAIDTACPGTRVVIVLREPVSRLISFFKFKQAQLELPRDMTLAGYVQACRNKTPEELSRRQNNVWFGLAGGCFAEHLPAWRDVFGDRCRVLFFDALCEDPRAVVRDLCGWLEIDPRYAQGMNTSIENKAADYRHAWAQSLALRVNRAGERFWRKHPGVKRAARGWYQRLNGRLAEVEADEDTLAWLRSYYTQANAGLLDQLPPEARANAPDWVKPQTVA